MDQTGRSISRRELFVGTGALAAAAGVLALPGGPAAASEGRFPLPTTRELNVLITGDAGTGEAGQWAVARAAKQIHDRENISLAIGLGDNIYENGPESGDDDEFASKFENPNAGIDVPWLMVLGNHDCSGIIPGSGGWPRRGDHEVEYHSRSRRWYMPSRYYSVPLPAADPVVEFFGIDTTPLTSYVMQTDPYYTYDGPFIREQRAWLDRSLAASKATWKIVFAHHPLRNNGKHGNAGEYDGIPIGNYISGIHAKKLYEEIVCGRANFILSGHDHTSQILDTAAEYKGTQQIVCGAAAKTGGGDSKITNKYFWQDFSSLGFMVMKIRDTEVVLDAYTVDPASSSPTLAHTQTTRR
ncbi:calcineurin-like phosphoesterase family protein [Herbihabitans rhizosphaerae]|uniref:Calcineurin-like phosphoesterase family protein n=1 Tax=Herbihabitans rhizosphaerae TaxID=1872711 RepID=A0A4Q7KZS8_9PSEU|nr:metallophosphoesterase [Herbihabitans rhizosphaerae]RZS41232.1 calcineurin-like phosphoesterase family protein [Herbihabitans rhizosphaerae]